MKKERHDNKNVKNTIGVQQENRRKIFTSVNRIDSIPNRKCFTCIRSWGLSGLASTGIQKLIENVLYLKKGSSVCRIETDGEGCILDQQAVKDLKL